MLCSNLHASKFIALYTIAVLGSGPDSEYPPGTEPRRYMFPRRNRLIAALSDELYVIEAGRYSGTQSTVETCMRYGHEVIRING